MRPRNVLTETNDMRKLMGLPLLKEGGGQTINDVKKKVLNESTIEYEDDQWLVIDKEEDKDEDKEEDKDEVNENAPAFSLGFARGGGLVIEDEEIDETTLSKDYDDEGVGKEPLDKEFDEPINEIEKAQKMAEERALKEKELKEQGAPIGDGPEGIATGLDVNGATAIGDGPDGMGESPDGMVTAEGSFAKYNITLEDGDIKKKILDESWFDNKKSYGDDLKKKDELEGYEPLTGLAELKDEARRIISFLTPGEGDEIEGKYMKEVYPAMALQVAESLYRKIEKMM